MHNFSDRLVIDLAIEYGLINKTSDFYDRSPKAQAKIRAIMIPLLIACEIEPDLL